MKREQLSSIICNIDEQLIAEAHQYDPDLCSHSPERIVHMNKKRIITLALAAALMLSLCVVAYAADLFGIRAMLMKNSTPTDNTDSGYVSFTQPQDVPEEMDESIRAKIENSTKAWAEWEAWSRENGIFEPESCKAPEGTVASTVEENPDGTVTMIFYRDSNN